MVESAKLSGPQLAKEYNAVVERLIGSAEANKFKPVKKFRTLSEGVKRLEAATKALEKSSPSKSNGEQGPKKMAFGSGVKVKPIVAGNPRREGTKGHEKYKEMIKWVTEHPDGTIDQLFSSTSYKRGDYKWDIEHKHIEEVK